MWVSLSYIRVVEKEDEEGLWSAGNALGRSVLILIVMFL